MEGDIKNVMKYWFEGEIETFIKVWLSIYASLCYCYFVIKITPRGLIRLLSFFPIICYFFYVPLKISSVHLGGTTGFFISWLCNFKLLLLAFEQGPLCDSSLSITKFLILACLPIKIQQKSKLFALNGHFQKTPSQNSAQNDTSGKGFCQHGHFQETPSQSGVQIGKYSDPNGNFQQKSNVFAQNGHFQETPSQNSAEMVINGKDFVQNCHFQESDQNCKCGNQNGHFQETPSQKSAQNVTNGKGFGQNSHFQESVQNGKYSNQNSHFQESPFPSCVKPNKGPNLTLNIGIKALLFALILRVYDYTDYIHPHILLTIYCFHIYFCLEIILAIVAGLARGLLGLELEPQFNEPYLSTSLQDFWGRRWNLMVTRILRPTVYNPTLTLSTNVLGRKWAVLPAIMSTFVVSGLMHEVIFYYLGRVKPTWEITWFFVLHGVCLSIEICVKKVVKGRFQLPRIIGTILTIGFVMITSFWLFFPQMLRCNSDVRAFKEYEAIGTFVKDVTRAVNATFFG